ncbi:hypothetical protein [Halosegnis longus]|uniref:hypothetical protein n=1 Tax=Halosegnis longus TaxID=2216012 RepID=UPI00129E0FD5|nr:hypothetical protein [Halosegnis longus]
MTDADLALVGVGAGGGLMLAAALPRLLTDMPLSVSASTVAAATGIGLFIVAAVALWRTPTPRYNRSGPP